MMGTNYVESSLKRFLKRKVKVTLGLVVAFMITGSVGYADFIIEDIDGGGKKLTGTNNEAITDYNSNNYGGVKLSEFKEIHINVTDKPGLKTWSGKFDLPNTDLYITVTGKNSNLDGIHLTNWNPHIVLNKYTANIDAPKSDALNLSHDATSAYATINELDAEVMQAHGIRANAPYRENNINTITINKSAKIITHGSDSAAVYAGDSAKYFYFLGWRGIETKGEGKISLKGNTIIRNSGDNSYGIYAGRNGNIIVNNLDIKSTGENSCGIVALNHNLIYSDSLDNSKNLHGSTVLLTGDTVKIHVKGNAFYTDSEYAKISSEKDGISKKIYYDIKGNILASNSGKIYLDSTSDSKVEGDITAESSGDIKVDLSNGGYFKGKTDATLKEIDGSLKNDGKINLTFGENTTWDMTGKSYVSDLKVNNSYINLSSTISSLMVHNLEGNGIFNLSVNKNGNRAEGNMLYITSSDKQMQSVAFDNNSILNLKVGEEIRFATIGKDTKGMEFKLAENIGKELGLRDLNLELKHEGYDITDVENKDYNGEGKPTENKPGSEVIDKIYGDGENWLVTKNSKGNLNDGASTIIEMAKANYASAVYMDNLNKRLGDMSFVEGNEGLWVRMRNDRVGEDSEYRLRNYMTQIGYDKTYDLDDGKEYRGVALDYTQGEMEYKNIHGKSNIDRYTFTAYDTRVYNSGAYADYVARAGYMESDFEIYGRQTGNKAEGDFDNLYFGLSAEFGKRYNFGEEERSYFEPQVQLQYTYIDDTDYTTNQNTKVDYDNIHSLIGRAGFRLGHDFYKENSKDNTIYLKADINHEFLGDQDVSAMDLTGKLDETYHNDGTWYDIGIGGAKNLSENLYVYADVERQFGTGKDNSWQFNLGFRYKFGTL